MITVTPIPAFKDNYIWLIAHNENWVVDPGEATPVIERLKSENRNLHGILITHHHADHTGGIADLISQFGKIPVYASHKSPNAFVTHRLKEGDTVHCDGVTFQVLEIPGHTLDHIAYVGNDLLFSGDTLFSAGCGRVFEGNPAQMLNSLNKLLALPDNTQVYCGHEYTLSNLKFAHTAEPDNLFIQQKLQQIEKMRAENKCSLPSLLRDEKKMNPFLRCGNSEMVAALKKYREKEFADSVDVFSFLREWKNNI